MKRKQDTKRDEPHSKMFEPVFKSTHQMRIVNKAFSSLSFRGKKGYSTNLVTRPQKQSDQSTLYKPSTKKAATYGAILCIKNKSRSETLYALVQGRYTGKWSFPKGHSNEGEAPLNCTLREVGEETGIDELPPPTEYLQVGYGNYFLFYLNEPVPLIPRDTHEIMDTKWVTLEEMERMPLNADASLYRKQLKAV